ncbi:type II toxin-antitoxin system HicB family antitoxin [Tunicatimonas pelagia]|uniref:type II toxin-antitoxin system HicB family antitoxin n=1 Tax=Tunicatimonas pelagia TaxID=931531 RepID=UPI0026663BE0|nr:2-oxoisovalerate dehydrogenase [Tunicatimonas pelagia]WKN40471.1 2-oxoisovalerate dehydrogenase [Tunicatimonas pelagia]
MTEIIFVVEEDLEGGYHAKALSDAIFTEGETLEELKDNIKEALQCHFEEEADRPKMVRLHLVKEEVFAA